MCDDVGLTTTIWEERESYHVDANVGTLLEQMKLMLNLDGFDDRLPLTQKAINKNDLKMVKEQLFGLDRHPTYIQPGMSMDQKKILGETFSGITMVERGLVPNSHALLANTRQLYEEIIVRSNAGAMIIDIGGNPWRHERLGRDIHSLTPTLSIKDVLRRAGRDNGKGCDHTIAECHCHDNTRRCIMAIDSIYDIEPSDLYEFMTRVGTTNLLFTVSTRASCQSNLTQGLLHDDQGYWFIKGDELVTFNEGESIPYVNNHRLTNMWTNADEIELGNGWSFYVQTISFCSNHIMRNLTLSKTGKTIDYSCPMERLDIMVPIIDTTSVLSKLVPHIRTRNIKLHLPLFDRLCNRNNLGKVTYGDLLAYARSISLSRYVINETRVARMNIDPSELPFQTYVAWMCSSIDNSSTNLSLKLMESTISGNLVEMLTLTTGNAILDEVSKPLRSVMGSKIIDGKFKIAISQLMNHHLWVGLRSRIQMYTKGYNLFNTQKPLNHSNVMAVCTHHSNCKVKHSEINNIGPNECNCCGLRCEGITCDCCKIKCSHMCNHTVCMGHYCFAWQTTGHCTHKELNCECCKRLGCYSRCPSCVDRPDEDIEQYELAYPKHGKRGYGTKNASRSNAETNLGSGNVQKDVGPSVKMPTMELLRKEKVGKPTITKQAESTQSVEEAILTTNEYLDKKFYSNETKGLFSKVNWYHPSLNDGPVTMPVVHYQLRHTKLYDCVNVQGYEPGWCGAACIALATGESLDDIKMIMPSSWINGEDIAKICITLNINSVVWDGVGSCVITSVNSSSYYAGFVHMGMVNQTNHWNCCTFEQLDIIGEGPDISPAFTSDYLCKLFRVSDFKKIKKSDRLDAYSIYLRGLKMVESGFNPLNLSIKHVRGENKTIMYNALIDDDSNMQVYRQVGEDAELMVKKMENIYGGSTIEIGDYNRPRLDDVQSNPFEGLSWGLIKEYSDCISILLGNAGKRSSNIKPYTGIAHLQRVSPRSQAFILESQTLQIKRGDLVEIEGKVLITYRIGGKLVVKIENTDRTLMVVKIRTYKLSAHSLYKKILAFANITVSWQRMKDLLRDARAIVGPAGSGKTTLAVSQMTKDDVVVAQTSGAVKSINTKCGKNRALTVERYSSLLHSVRKSRPHTLFIDEAGQLTYEDVWPLLDPNTRSIVLIGDTTQIGKVDMNKSAGTRSIHSLLDHVKEGNVTRLQNCYRIGGPLGEYLQDVTKESCNYCGKHIDLEIVAKQEMNDKEIAKITADRDISLVLTFYDNDYNRLRGMFKNTKIEVGKVHSYQGNESARVLVLHRLTSIGRSSITGDPKYIYSAMTRCTDSVIWITITDDPARIPTPKQLMMGGAGDDGNCREQTTEDTNMSRECMDWMETLIPLADNVTEELKLAYAQIATININVRDGEEFYQSKHKTFVEQDDEEENRKSCKFDEIVKEHSGWLTYVYRKGDCAFVYHKLSSKTDMIDLSRGSIGELKQEESIYSMVCLELIKVIKSNSNTNAILENDRTITVGNSLASIKLQLNDDGSLTKKDRWNLMSQEQLDALNSVSLMKFKQAAGGCGLNSVCNRMIEMVTCGGCDGKTLLNENGETRENGSVELRMKIGTYGYTKLRILARLCNAMSKEGKHMNLTEVINGIVYSFRATEGCEFCTNMCIRNKNGFEMVISSGYDSTNWRDIRYNESFENDAEIVLSWFGVHRRTIIDDISKQESNEWYYCNSTCDDELKGIKIHWRWNVELFLGRLFYLVPMAMSIPRMICGAKPCRAYSVRNMHYEKKLVGVLKQIGINGKLTNEKRQENQETVRESFDYNDQTSGLYSIQCKTKRHRSEMLCAVNWENKVITYVNISGSPFGLMLSGIKQSEFEFNNVDTIRDLYISYYEAEQTKLTWKLTNIITCEWLVGTQQPITGLIRDLNIRRLDKTDEIYKQILTTLDQTMAREVENRKTIEVNNQQEASMIGKLLPKDDMVGCMINTDMTFGQDVFRTLDYYLMLISPKFKAKLYTNYLSAISVFNFSGTMKVHYQHNKSVSDADRSLAIRKISSKISSLQKLGKSEFDASAEQLAGFRTILRFATDGDEIVNGEFSGENTIGMIWHLETMINNLKESFSTITILIPTDSNKTIEVNENRREGYVQFLDKIHRNQIKEIEWDVYESVVTGHRFTFGDSQFYCTSRSQMDGAVLCTYMMLKDVDQRTEPAKWELVREHHNNRFAEVEMVEPADLWSGILTGDFKILKTSRIRINKLILKRLINRLNLIDCTITDLRTYARTLMNANYYTSSAVVEVIKMTSEDVERHCLIAYMMQKINMANISEMLTLQERYGGSIQTNNQESIVNDVSNWLTSNLTTGLKECVIGFAGIASANLQEKMGMNGFSVPDIAKRMNEIISSGVTGHSNWVVRILKTITHTVSKLKLEFSDKFATCIMVDARGKNLKFKTTYNQGDDKPPKPDRMDLLKLLREEEDMIESDSEGTSETESKPASEDLNKSEIETKLTLSVTPGRFTREERQENELCKTKGPREMNFVTTTNNNIVKNCTDEIQGTLEKASDEVNLPITHANAPCAVTEETIDLGREEEERIDESKNHMDQPHNEYANDISIKEESFGYRLVVERTEDRHRSDLERTFLKTRLHDVIENLKPGIHDLIASHGIEPRYNFLDESNDMICVERLIIGDYLTKASNLSTIHSLFNYNIPKMDEIINIAQLHRVTVAFCYGDKTKIKIIKPFFSTGVVIGTLSLTGNGLMHIQPGEYTGVYGQYQDECIQCDCSIDIPGKIRHNFKNSDLCLDDRGEIMMSHNQLLDLLRGNIEELGENFKKTEEIRRIIKIPGLLNMVDRHGRQLIFTKFLSHTFSTTDEEYLRGLVGTLNMCIHIVEHKFLVTPCVVAKTKHGKIRVITVNEQEPMIGLIACKYNVTTSKDLPVIIKPEAMVKPTYVASLKDLKNTTIMKNCKLERINGNSESVVLWNYDDMNHHNHMTRDLCSRVKQSRLLPDGETAVPMDIASLRKRPLEKGGIVIGKNGEWYTGWRFINDHHKTCIMMLKMVKNLTLRQCNEMGVEEKTSMINSNHAILIGNADLVIKEGNTVDKLIEEMLSSFTESIVNDGVGNFYISLKIVEHDLCRRTNGEFGSLELCDGSLPKTGAWDPSIWYSGEKTMRHVELLGDLEPDSSMLLQGLFNRLGSKSANTRRWTNENSPGALVIKFKHDCISNHIEDIQDDSMSAGNLLVRGNKLIIKKLNLVLIPPSMGAGSDKFDIMRVEDDERHEWKGEPHTYLRDVNAQQKAKENNEKNRRVKAESNKSALEDLDAYCITLIEPTVRELGWEVAESTGMVLDTVVPHISVLFDNNHVATINAINEDVPAEIVNYWDDEDMTDHVVRYAPENTNTMAIKSREDFGPLVVEKKFSLVPHPIYCKPVFTKKFGGVFNTMTGVHGGFIELKTEELNIELEFSQLMNTYMRADHKCILEGFQSMKIDFSIEATIDWLSKAADGVAIVEQMKKWLMEGMHKVNLNTLNIHAKLESLIKEPVQMFKEESKVRPIVWQQKVVAGLFSPIFIEAKRRLKMLLKDEFVYVDGCTQAEISSRLRSVIRGNNDTILENDLTKQDRQTIHELLKLEMMVYKALGVNSIIVDLWYTAHKHWKVSNQLMSGHFDAMRQTGQATTALGNVIVQLIVHRRLVAINQHKLKIMLMLGDDHLSIWSSHPHYDVTRQLGKYYNMIAKPIYRENFGVFLQMIVYAHGDGFYCMGPDYVRLCKKFVLTNGVSEVNTETLKLRSLSYLMMMGRDQNTIELAKSINEKVELQPWHETLVTIQCLKERYPNDENYVEWCYSKLLELIRNPKVYEHKFLVVGTSKI
jgi:hypothetical protein